MPLSHYIFWNIPLTVKTLIFHLRSILCPNDKRLYSSVILWVTVLFLVLFSHFVTYLFMLTR